MSRNTEHTGDSVTRRQVTQLGEKEAISLLPDGDMIHTFRCEQPNMLIGADWKREHVIESIKKFGAGRSGDVATSMHHGLHIPDKGRGLFVETRKSAQLS